MIILHVLKSSNFLRGKAIKFLNKIFKDEPGASLKRTCSTG